MTMDQCQVFQQSGGNPTFTLGLASTLLKGDTAFAAFPPSPAGTEVFPRPCGCALTCPISAMPALECPASPLQEGLSLLVALNGQTGLWGSRHLHTVLENTETCPRILALGTWAQGLLRRWGYCDGFWK